MLLMTLESLGSFAKLMITKAVIASLASEQSVLTAGIAGAIQGAALTVAIEVALAGARTALKAEDGMYINGRRHSQGGTIIEAEDGEYIASRKLVSAYAPQLNMMAASVNGAQIPNAGQSRFIDYERLAAMINDQQIYVVDRDITNQQSRSAKLADRVTF